MSYKDEVGGDCEFYDIETDGCAKRNIAPLRMDAAAPNAKSMGKSHKIDRQ